MNYYKSTLAYHIRMLRIMNGYSQQYIADKLHKTTNAISNWELGKTSPPIDDMMNLCALYGVSPNQLFGIDKIPGLIEFVNAQGNLVLELNKLEDEKRQLEYKQEEIKRKMKALSNSAKTT